MSKCIFKACLNGSWDLRAMHATGICKSQFGSNHVTLVKILLKDNFHCYRSNVFSKSLWMGLRFRSYDTRCLEFCRMSNYRNCRCLFWSVYVTLAKLIICKVNFHCHRQNVFESFSECFSGFKTYGTDQLHQFFSNIKLGRLQIIILK